MSGLRDEVPKIVDSVGARTEVLRRIRAATHGSASAETIDAGWQGIERAYRSKAGRDRAAVLDLLEDRLRDYDAGVYRSSSAEVALLAVRILGERGKTAMAIPSGFPQDWRPTGSSVRFYEDDRTSVSAIDACHGVLTSATLAIAETGTIVLQDAPGQGRRALTLLPDYHLCVVDTARVVETVPEAMQILHAMAARATTFFSGPSATADIEMTRIKGVHGPRFVDVLLVVSADIPQPKQIAFPE